MEPFETVLPQLIQIPLFADFDVQNDSDVRILRELYAVMAAKDYKAGELIIEEGEPELFCYFLYRGAIQVFSSTPAGDTIALANLCAEQHVFFGETAILSSEPRSHSVRAVSDSSALRISGKDFLDMCRKEPVLGFRVMFYIAKNLKKTIKETNNDKAILYEALFNEIEGYNG